jgi:hypothetical protein
MSEEFKAKFDEFINNLLNDITDQNLKNKIDEEYNKLSQTCKINLL